MLVHLSIRDFVDRRFARSRIRVGLHRADRRDRRRQVHPHRCAGAGAGRARRRGRGARRRRARRQSPPNFRSRRVAGLRRRGCARPNSRATRPRAAAPRGRSRRPLARFHQRPPGDAAAACARSADWLVDIHGQHAHQSLLKGDAQRGVLDAHAGLDAAGARGERRRGASGSGWPRRAPNTARTRRHARPSASSCAGRSTSWRKLAPRRRRVGGRTGRAEPPRARREPDRRRAGGARCAHRVRIRRDRRAVRGDVAPAGAWSTTTPRCSRTGRSARRRGGADRRGRACAAPLRRARRTGSAAAAPKSSARIEATLRHARASSA